MDFLILELVCWGGLLFFFWALKDGLGKVESDIESMSLYKPLKTTRPPMGTSRFATADEATEPIGTYAGETIYRYVVIDGNVYEFNRVLAPEPLESLVDEERCVAPGLIYLEKGKASSQSPFSANYPR